MWAVGCILFTFLAGYQPFEEDQLISVLLRIFKTCGTPALDMETTEYPTLFQLCPELLSITGQFPQWYDSIQLADLLPDASPEALDLLFKLFTVDPARRISASDALNHPFFETSIR